MLEAMWGVVFLAVLAGGCVLGFWLQERLDEFTRSRDALDAVRMVLGMLMTFSALVLGLLVTSAKADFDGHTDVYRRYGTSLIRLDQRLRDAGPASTPVRAALRAYTAAVLVDYWPEERRPPGAYPTGLALIDKGSDESRLLTDMLWQIDRAVRALPRTDPIQAEAATLAEEEMRDVETQRWTLVERAQSRLSSIFLSVLMFWLLIVFVVFGIVSPRNRLTLVVIGLSAVSVASSLYLIVDLDTSTGGFIKVSSRPMQDALWHMDHDS